MLSAGFLRIKIVALLVCATLASLDSFLPWDDDRHSTDTVSISCPSRKEPLIFFQKYEGRSIHINVTQIQLWFNRSQLAVYTHPHTNAANLLVGDVKLLVLASVKDGVRENGKTFSSVVLYDHINWGGSAHILKSLFKKDKLVDCNIQLLQQGERYPMDVVSFDTDVLRAPVQACLQSQICKKIGAIRPEEYTKALENPVRNWGYFKIEPDYKQLYRNVSALDITHLMSLARTDVKSFEFQSAFNWIVDLVIFEIKKKIKEESNGLIKLPDINEAFSKEGILKNFGEFDAVNGEFSDLTSLNRIGDAHLHHDDLKFTASCGFGLSRAKVHYDKYKLKYGISVSGEFTADVDGMIMNSTLVIDYSKKPCKISLQHLDIVDLGKLDIDITGLGPLNGLSSDVISWITKHWRNTIIRRAQDMVEGVVQDFLSKIDCEKFRP